MANAARPSARARGYNTAWDKARSGFLRSHPHCVMCHGEGKIIAATHVDHVIPHKGDQALFWDKANWQGLCSHHHNSTKQEMEKRGFSSRVDASGLPVDQRHPFFAGADDQPAATEASQRPRRPRLAGSQAGVGGSKVVDRKGMGPLGFLPAELVRSRGRADG